MCDRPPLALFTCAYCGAIVAGEPEYTIHRDGFGDGPEVPLCQRCGANEEPSCSDIWRRIAHMRPPVPEHALN